MLKRFNELRLGVKDTDFYINTGVLLMNLAGLRKLQKKEEVLRIIGETSGKLFLPDQDVMTILYGDKLLEIDTFQYNLSDRMYNLGRLKLIPGMEISPEWVEKHTSIIHFCGNVRFNLFNGSSGGIEWRKRE